MIFLDITPGPSWLNAGDNGWQLTSATLVSLMSVPGLAIMYAGLVKIGRASCRERVSLTV